MTARTDGRTLPWRVLDRAVRPYALAVSISTFVVSYAILAVAALTSLLSALASLGIITDSTT